MIKILPFSVLKEETVYKDGERLSVIKSELETPESKKVAWTYIQTKNGVIVVAVNENKEIYVKKEWRLNRKDFVWELPSVWVEIKNPTEQDILKEANRELSEEVYLKAHNLKVIEKFYPSNLLSGIFYVVLATQLEINKGTRDEHEFIEYSKIPINDIKNYVTHNQIPNAQTLLGIFAAENYLNTK